MTCKKCGSDLLAEIVEEGMEAEIATETAAIEVVMIEAVAIEVAVTEAVAIEAETAVVIEAEATGTETTKVEKEDMPLPRGQVEKPEVESSGDGR
jgi:hypothetical protein